MGSKTVAEPHCQNNLVPDTATILRKEVERSGPISFARFMEAALYCPKSGYYLREANPVGREGDFYTNVSVGSVFGAMLAFQFADWLEHLSPGPVQLVEAGAHDGQLALDILHWLGRNRPTLHARLKYWLIEPSPHRQAKQRATLNQFAGQICWAVSPRDLGDTKIIGIIFSNELIDAFPTHRLAWDRSSAKWVEWGVGLSAGKFIWTRLLETAPWEPELAHAGFDLTPEFKAVLPDGFTIEHCRAARTWWQEAAGLLHQGRLMTIDYGFTAAEVLSPQRGRGTLRAYRKHRIVHDVLDHPGEQDITSHVNFTQLERAGEAEGLKTEGFQTQAQFLTEIARSMWAEAKDAPSPTEARQFQTLTHPEHLGRPFRVLVQSRNG
jgi:SAM-dependent MidA family methyltransferase